MPQLKLITPDDFSGKFWKFPENLSFAGKENLIPVVLGEVAKLVSQLPLALVEADNKFHLVAVTAFQQGMNYFINPDGQWVGYYTPAELRSYPFRLHREPGQEKSVLCIHADYPLSDDPEQGNPFFNEAGEPSETIRGILEHLSRVEQSTAHTRIAVDALVKAGVIKPWAIQVKAGEQIHPVKGLHCVDENALNSLPDETWLELRKTGALTLAYAQLISMHQIALLQRVINMRSEPGTTDAAQPVANSNG